jgi:hypothetical protein
MLVQTNDCILSLQPGLELVGDSGEIVAEFHLTSPTSYMKAKTKSPDFIDPLLKITNNNNNCE